MTIKANDAIHNYPDSNCPTILVYQQGAIIKTWVTALPFGGNSLSRKSFELELVKLGVLTPAELLGVDGEEDLDLKINKTNDGHTSLFLTAKHGRGNARDEDEDEEDDDDRPANNKRNKNHTGSIADTGNDGRGGWKEIRFDLK
ncbi:MAG: hypothetical protein EZS28_042749 [Streblomastix strix]|uniref:Phosducin thioredoxin-like domain-containing protein n=1 Tax=Streblomastix strix TaxID=222440 RepID=A0A5J4TWF9_9EUKA|nr:MAG: hypothetical protein EZS28_042749 [Streblomastix strix]